MLKNKMKLQRDNIYLGVVKINNRNIKKIIYTLNNKYAIDIFNSSTYPTSAQYNTSYVEEHIKIDRLLKFLKFKQNLSKKNLRKLRKIIYCENYPIINKNHEKIKGKTLKKQIFGAMYYKAYFKNLK